MAFHLSTISIKALLISMAIVYVASGIFTFLFVFILSVSYGAKDAAQFQAVVPPAAMLTWGVALNVIIGVGTGYLAALIAKRAELLHGALSSALSVGVGLYIIVFGATPEFLVRNIIFTAAVPFLGLMGGWLRQRLAQRAAINAKSA